MEHFKLCENEGYYLTRISIDDEEDIHTFECRKDGGFLESYLKEVALFDEESDRAKTYLVRDTKTNELVAYFSLKAGFVSINEKGLFRSTFDTIPAVELMNFAVNINYLRLHPDAKGIGAVVFIDFVLWAIRKAQEWVGIDIVYLFALPHDSLIQRYREYGFSRLSLLQERVMHRRIRPRYDRNCIFMFRQI